MPHSQALLVLGPHRSGTSAFTRVFNLLGVDLGSQMLPPKADNRQGFWEHGEIFEIHEQLLARLGSSWHDFRPLPSGWHEDEGADRFRSMLGSFLIQEFDGKPLWGVKDPRMCRLLPLWIRVLEELEVEPRFLIVVRNPLEVIRSLEKRNQFSPSKSLLLYLADMLAAIHHTRGLRRGFVSYSRLLEDWRRVVADAGRGLGLDWPHQDRACEEEIDLFLRPSERHHRYTLADLEREPFVPVWCRELQAALEGACTGDGREADPVFSGAYDALQAACALFVPELDRLERRLARASAAHAAAEKEVLRLGRSDPPAEDPAREPRADRDRRDEEERRDGDQRDEGLRDRVAGLEARNAELREALELAHRERALLEDRQVQLQHRSRRAEDELRKVQKHLTSILSTPLYRSTRPLRRGWRRLTRLLLGG